MKSRKFKQINNSQIEKLLKLFNISQIGIYQVMCVLVHTCMQCYLLNFLR